MSTNEFLSLQDAAFHLRGDVWDTLGRVGHSLTSSRSLCEKLDAVLEGVLEVLNGCSEASVFVFREEQLTCSTILHADSRSIEHPEDIHADDFLYSIVQKGESAVMYSPIVSTRATNESTPILRTIVGVPLKMGERIVGVISVSYRERRILSDSELQQLQFLGDQAAIAIENAWLEERAEHRAADMHFLLDVIMDLVTAPSLTEALQHIAKSICDSLNALTVTIYLAENDPIQRDTSPILRAKALAGSNKPLSAIKVAQIGEPDSLIGLVARDHNAAVVDFLLGEPGYVPVSAQATSAIVVPLFINQLLVGLIAVEYAATSPYDPEVTTLLLTLVPQLSSIIQNAMLFQDLRESEERFRQITENIKEAFCLIDCDKGEIIYRSPPYQTIWGVSPISAFEDCSLSSWIETFAEEDRPRITADMRAASGQGGGSQQHEYHIRRANGEERWTRLTFNPVKDEHGNLYRLATIVEDITERMRAEEQAKDLIAERQRVRLLQEFVSDASHDLKSPLSSLQLNLELLRMKYPDFRNRQIETLELETQHLICLVDELLTMSRLDAGKSAFNFSPVNINSMIYDIVAAQKTHVLRKGHQVSLMLDNNIRFISADEVELKRAIMNLVVNAINYTGDNGTITLRTARRDNAIVVEVTDTGIGIATSDMPKIFDRFYRADKARQVESGGTGLGLAIVKKIVEGHGGSIEVKSELNKGSIFRILLPSILRAEG